MPADRAPTPTAYASCSRRSRARSGGKVKLSVIDPLPFSEDEDRASSFGLQAVPIGHAGETIFFGLAGTNATDGQAVIPFFQPDKEAFLEYDIAKLVNSLVTTTKPVVGLMSGLEIGPGFDPQTRQMRPGWAVYTSLSELFDVRTVDPQTTSTIDPDDRTHGRGASQGDQRGRAVRDSTSSCSRGGNLVAFVDPNAELDQQAEDPNNPLGGAVRQPFVRSRAPVQGLGRQLRPGEGRAGCGQRAAGASPDRRPGAPHGDPRPAREGD